MNIRILFPSHQIVFSCEDGVTADSAWIRAAKKGVRAALYHQNVDTPVSVELSFVSADTIQDLNRAQRQTDRVTDVLSFPSLNVEKGAQPSAAADTSDYTGAFLFLGSVVICVNRALEQADAYGHSPEREFAFLAAHSVLHLLGYDHERSQQEETEMFDLQREILHHAGISR